MIIISRCWPAVYFNSYEAAHNTTLIPDMFLDVSRLRYASDPEGSEKVLEYNYELSYMNVEKRYEMMLGYVTVTEGLL